MYRSLIVVLLLLFTSVAYGQLWPREGRVLHYRVVPFMFSMKGAAKAKIEVARGKINNDDTFKSNIVGTAVSTNGRALIEVPSFNQEYTWRVVPIGKSKVAAFPTYNHFSTGWNSNVDISKTRLTITKKAIKYSDAYVMSDMSKVLYDMGGNPIWYLPNIPGVTDNNSVIRDLKMSPAHTLTFLSSDKPFEIDYDGNVLWRWPHVATLSHDSIEHYHHEFTRLKNGHYMVLGNELLTENFKPTAALDSNLPEVMPPVPNLKDPALADEVPDARPAQRMKPDKKFRVGYGTILEYDEHGKLIWWWRSSDYYKSVDFHSCKTGKRQFDIHENAFFFDEENQFIYISFKNINQIVKLKYPEGKMTNILGSLYYPNTPCPDSALFWEQHAVKISKSGKIYLYNNNMLHLNEPPTIVVMDEPKGSTYYLRKVWEYAYPVDLKGRARLTLTNGGNVLELPDESFFASTCTPFGNMFIVNRDHELVWDALLERWNEVEKKWGPLNQYRASIINNRKDFETMVWRSIDLLDPKN